METAPKVLAVWRNWKVSTSTYFVRCSIHCQIQEFYLAHICCHGLWLLPIILGTLRTAWVPGPGEAGSEISSSYTWLHSAAPLSRVHHEKCWKRKVVWPTRLRRVTFSIAAPALRTTLHTPSAGSWKPKHRYRYNTQYHLQERSFVAQWSNIMDILNVQSNAMQNIVRNVIINDGWDTFFPFFLQKKCFVWCILKIVWDILTFFVIRSCHVLI